MCCLPPSVHLIGGVNTCGHTARIIIIYPNQLLSRIYLGPMASKFNPGTIGKPSRDGPGVSSYTVCYLVMYLVLWSKVKFNFHGVVVLHDAIFIGMFREDLRVSLLLWRHTQYIQYIYTYMCKYVLVGHYSYTSRSHIQSSISVWPLPGLISTFSKVLCD